MAADCASSFNHRGDLLATQSDEGMLRLWDPRTGRQLLGVQTDADPRFGADDRHLGIGSGGQGFQMFEVASGRELRTLPGDPAPDRVPQDLSFEPDGRILAAPTREGVKLWDAESAKLLADFSELGWSSARFEGNGTLLTFGLRGLNRWPMRREGSRLELGPPQLLRISGSRGGMSPPARMGKPCSWPAGANRRPFFRESHPDD